MSFFAYFKEEFQVIQERDPAIHSPMEAGLQLFGFQGPEDPYHGEQLPSGILESHRCQPDADELQ